MKKVEERDGKMFVDGFEYEKVNKKVFGVDVNDIENFYRCLDGYDISFNYNELSRVIGGNFRPMFNIEGKMDRDVAQSIKEVIKFGLLKLDEENEKVGK